RCCPHDIGARCCCPCDCGPRSTLLLDQGLGAGQQQGCNGWRCCGGPGSGTQGAGGRWGKGRLYTAVWSGAEDLSEIRVSRSLLEDHLPMTVLWALERTAEDLKEVEKGGV
ncbi:unnamed protein product, partial [Discosporangium mesarthrocarpum]